MRLYYMTSARWGEVILKERRLKLSRFHEMNDPFELQLIDSGEKQTRKVVQQIAEYHEKNVGILCFGAGWSSPVMWAHYTEKHTGVCLGFDVQDDLVQQVAYTGEKIKVPLGKHLPRAGLSADLLNKLLSTKATDWAYEREYRVMGRLETADPHTGLYYTDFGEQVQLREVIIGHRCTWTPAGTRMLLGDVAAPVRICKARPAFGKFEMVEQKQVTPVTAKPKRK